MKCLFVAAGALALGIGTASAQEPTYNWSGAYVGAQIGYGWTKSVTSLSLDPTTSLSVDNDPGGALGGLYAGYNYQMSNNVVLGLDVDINAANYKAESDDWSLHSGGTKTTVDDFIPTSFDISWNGAVRGRAGYAVGRFLPYVAGGVSFGEYRFRLDGGASHRSTRAGWNIGAGIDYAVTDKITLRGEYRFTDFGSDKFSFEGVPSEVDLKTNDILLGVAYNF
jgi:outer membrane immunogenic protein